MRHIQPASRSNVFLAFVTTFLFLLTATVASGDPGQRLTGFSGQVSPFLKKHCVRCHGPEESEADIRVDELPLEIGDGRDAESWQEVLDVLNGSEMPPEDEPQPTTNELTTVIESLTNELHHAGERLQNTGGVVLRRLNKREYANTIADLLGVDVDTSNLPSDGNYEGFDTVGDALTVSTLHFERYLRLAKDALGRAFAERTRPETTKVHNEVEIDWLQSVQAQGQKARAFLASPEAAKRTETARKKNRNRVAESEVYPELPGAKTGVLMARKSAFVRGINEVTFTLFDHAPGKYVLRFRAGVTNENTDAAFHFEARRVIYQKKGRVEDFAESLGTVALTRVQPQGEVFEIPFEKTSVGRRELLELRVTDATLRHAVAAQAAARKTDGESAQAPMVWLDWVEIEGPVTEVWPPAAWTRFFPQGFSVDEKKEDAYANEIIRRFAFDAFRHRSPTEEYVDGLRTIYRDYRSDGASFVDAVSEALAIVLASPGFIYLVEGDSGIANESGGSNTRQLLSERELACRLSYFLWSAPPDERLYSLAVKGKLSTPEVLAGEVNRMLDDERSRVFVDAFTRQWLELDRLDMIAVSKDYEDFSESLRVSFKRETIETMRALIQHNVPADKLIDSDFVVVDAQLADFYGLDGETGLEFKAVKLPNDSPRGGLLGQAGILTLNGTGDRTSPVERGVYVLRKLLGTPPPPPPPNVPQLEFEASASVRERLALHTQKAQCASCHRRIDPIGFGLENFDAIGSWRDKEGKHAIDATGVMPDGEGTFDGPQELKAQLLEEIDSMAESLLRSMMTFAIGRRIGFEDRGTVDAIRANWKEQDYGMRSLIHVVVQSDAFRMK